MKEQWFGAIRAVLALGGGYIVGAGVIDSGGADAAIAALMGLVAVGWSAWEKRKAANAAEKPAS